MRIIKQGTIPEDKPYVIECRDCQTVFECMAKEGAVTYDQRDGDYFSVACPTCHRVCATTANRRF